MIIVIIFSLLFLSFATHIIIIVQYITKKTPTLFYSFVVTALINISLGIALSIVALSNPELIQSVNFELILWILSGFVMGLLLILKILFFHRLYMRTKDPDMYFVNFFGKKVYKKGMIKQYEFLYMFLSIPFFLIIGAYFIARLINFMLYGTL